MVRLQRSQLGWHSKRSTGLSNTDVSGGLGGWCSSEARLTAETDGVGWGGGEGKGKGHGQDGHLM